jgi:hypothetical protein
MRAGIRKVGSPGRLEGADASAAAQVPRDPDRVAGAVGLLQRAGDHRRHGVRAVRRPVGPGITDRITDRIGAGIARAAGRSESRTIAVSCAPRAWRSSGCGAMDAVASFLTPIGHHGNLLILNRGRYTFADFLRIGIPLTQLIAFVTAWLSRWRWLDRPLPPG